MSSSDSSLERSAWQAEADLLADGREQLEKMCGTRRYRHLFPGGPNLALLLQAYQELDRARTVRRDLLPGDAGYRSGRDRRRLRRMLRRLVRADALKRDRRLLWHLPRPTPLPLRTAPPAIVRRALEQVDPDARDEVEAQIRGTAPPELDDDDTLAAPARVEARLERGLDQLRVALINHALANPDEIPILHPQYIEFTNSDQPTKRKHPIATLILVRLPLQFLMVLATIFLILYTGAYLFFNDERLGQFLTAKIGSLLDGELEFESTHWDPTLIVDLMTGQPHTLHCEGVRVYEGFKIDGVEKKNVTAYAEHLEVDLVLHEIIPWRRLGLKTPTEIPWILHFTRVRNHGEMWVNVREYQDKRGDWKLSLIQAFRIADESEPAPGVRKMSIQVEDCQLPNLELGLDFVDRGGWDADLQFDDLAMDLDFEGAFPGAPPPDRIPFRYRVEGSAPTGSTHLLRLTSKTIEIEDLESLAVTSGWDGTPLGDTRIKGDGRLGGSPASFDGFLRDSLGKDVAVEYRIATTNLGPVSELFLPEPAKGRRPMLDGHGSRAAVRIEGPLDDVRIGAVGQGMTLDFFEESAWAMDDVDLSLVLARDPVPDDWREHYGTSAAKDRATGPPSTGPPQRWIAYLETFRGYALDGHVRLHGRGQQDLVVLAGEGEPLMASLYLDLEGINPEQFVPENASAGALLRGSARGGVHLHELSLLDGGKGGLSHVEVSLRRFRMTRDADDRLPKVLRADGEFAYDSVTGLDLRNLTVGTDGGELRLTGGFDVGFDHLRPTSLFTDVHDGRAFLAQFGTQPYFERLRLDMDLAGRVPVPSGRGSLTILGASGSGLSLGDIDGARLTMDRGTLKVRAERAELLGGSGPLEVDLVLAEGGSVLKDPRLRVYLDLEGMDRKQILGAPIDAEGARLRLYVDDGENRPIRLSKLQARGAASAQRLRISGIDYTNADAAFAFTREGMAIERMTLDYSRILSPQLAPGVRVAVGRVEATGTVGFASDPELDLEVDASGLPLSALTAFFEQDVDIDGKLASGSRLEIGGTLRSPIVEGSLELAALGISGVPLGRGSLKFETSDKEAGPGPGGAQLEARREIQISGSFAEGRIGNQRRGQLDWGVEGTVAFARKGKRPPEADVRVRFTSLPVSTLLHLPSTVRWQDSLVGQLQGLELETRYCPEDSDLLSACVTNRNTEDDVDPLSIHVGLDHFWVRARPEDDDAATAIAGLTDPCNDPSALCSTGPLQATLDDGELAISPWKLRSGGKRKRSLEVRGRFDLRPAVERGDRKPSEPGHSADRCRPGVITRQSLGSGLGDAQIVGTLDLGALEGLLRPWEIRSPEGNVLVNLDIKGRVTDPDISGDVDLAPDSPAIALTLRGGTEDSPRRRKSNAVPTLPVDISAVNLHLQDGALTADGTVRVGAEQVQFGQIDGKPTYLQFAGECAGSYGASMVGVIDGRIPKLAFPNLFESTKGAATLERLHVAGRLDDFSSESTDPMFQIFDGEIVFGRKTMQLAMDFDTFQINGGRIKLKQCRAGDRCADSSGDFAIFVGGERGAASRSRPGSALSIAVGDRGAAGIWGDIRMHPRFKSISSTEVRSSLSMFPFTMNDNSGRPELQAELSSEALTLTSGEGGAMRISGKVSVERSRWLRDAIQGVKVLSFADPYPPSGEPLPDVLDNLELDLALRTTNPFTVDNNVLKDLEGQADLRLEGTLGAPELTGSLDVTRGAINVDILGGLYDISRGRVGLDRELSRSQVLLRAVKRDPVNIEGQLYALVMHLSGSLEAIEWSCTALGNTTDELATAQGCIDYLIFDAGNATIAETDITQRGQGDLLGNRFLPLAGKIAQLKVNDRLEDQLPQVERYLPQIVFRADQLGVVADLRTRPEWLQWGWGGASLGASYLSGYPGSVIRDSRDITGRIDILDNTYLQFGWGFRNYTTRILILDPPSYGDFKLGRRIRIPSVR